MQRYEFDDGKSSKFWQVKQSGAELHIGWGKIGTVGQSQVKTFDDEAKATSARDKLVAEKTKKGYVAVGADAVSNVAQAAQALKLTQAQVADPTTVYVGTDGTFDNADKGSSSHESAEALASQAPVGSADETACAPDTPDDAAELAAKLAELRSAPSADQRLLAAWREALGQVAKGDLGLLAPKLATVAQLKKRFALAEPLARVLAEWLGEFVKGDGLRDWQAAELMAVAQALLCEPELAELEAEASESHAAHWANASGEQSDKRFAAAAVCPRFHLPQWPDETDGRRVLASWRAKLLDIKVVDELQPELDALRAQLKADGVGTPETDAFWIAISEQGAAVELFLIHHHGLPGYVQRLLLAAPRFIGQVFGSRADWGKLGEGQRNAHE